MKKKYCYIIQVESPVVVFANDLDEALERASMGPLDTTRFKVLAQWRMKIPEEQINRNTIHSNN